MWEVQEPAYRVYFWDADPRADEWELAGCDVQEACCEPVPRAVWHVAFILPSRLVEPQWRPWLIAWPVHWSR